MSGDLVALQLPPTRIGPWLRRVWDDGDAVLPLDPVAPDATTEAILERMAPARLVGWTDEGRETVDELTGSAPVTADTALVVATSGSTGPPKGVVLTHEAVEASTTASLRRLGCRSGEAWLGCLPTHHVAGLQTLLRSWALGASPVVHDRFETDAVAAADAAYVSLVPTQLARLLDAGVELTRFAAVLLGGARPPAELLERARTAGARLVVSYGMSETCGGCVYDGGPLDGAEARVDDEGRIRLRGRMRFSEYRGDAAATAASIDAGGWFITGDAGRWRDGGLEVVGRVDDVVVSGGENVPLEAVASALRSHPQVRDAAASAREDAAWGQVVVAAVVPEDPTAPPSLSSLRDHVRCDHPPAFAPREVGMVEVIPRDRLGKVPRAVLDDLLGITDA